MFTGIIQAIGEVSAIETYHGDLRLSIRSGKLDLRDVAIGDSICVSGVCLTVVELFSDGFAADVSGETISRTIMHSLRRGSRVNLEKSVTPITYLGGHLVSGHVDGIGKVITRRTEARSIRFLIAAPENLARYIAEKGSICVDGVSLTVNSVNGATFELNIIPHTGQETTLTEYAPGREVNLEVDIISRYLERLLLGERTAHPQNGITRRLLTEAGFIQD